MYLFFIGLIVYSFILVCSQLIMMGSLWMNEYRSGGGRSQCCLDELSLSRPSSASTSLASKLIIWKSKFRSFESSINVEIFNDFSNCLRWHQTLPRVPSSLWTFAKVNEELSIQFIEDFDRMKFHHLHSLFLTDWLVQFKQIFSLCPVHITVNHFDVFGRILQTNMLRISSYHAHLVEIISSIIYFHYSSRYFLRSSSLLPRLHGLILVRDCYNVFTSSNNTYRIHHGAYSCNAYETLTVCAQNTAIFHRHVHQVDFSTRLFDPSYNSVFMPKMNVPDDA